MLKELLFICFMVLCRDTVGQDTAQESINHKKARSFSESGLWDSAFHYNELSAGEYLQEGRIGQYLSHQLDIVKAYLKHRKNQEALDLLNEIMQTHQTMLRDLQLDVHYHYQLAVAYGNISKTFDSYRHAKKALELAGSYPETTADLYFNILDVVGPACRRLGLYNEALAYANRSLNYVQDSLTLSHAYNSLGLIHSRLLNRQRALVYFKKSLALREKYHPEWVPYVINNIGLLFQKTGQPDSAMFWFNRGLEKSAALFDHKKLVSAALYYNRSMVLKDLKDYEKTVEDLKKTMEIASIHDKKQVFIYYLVDIAWLLIEIGKVDEGREYLRQCEASGIETMSDEHRVHFYFSYAKLYRALQKPDSSLFYYNKILDLSTFDLTVLNEEDELMMVPQDELVSVLVLKLKALKAMYHQTGSATWLRETIRYHKPLVENILNLAYEHSSLATSSNFFKNSGELLGLMAFAAAELYNIENEDKYLDIVATLMEFQRMNFIKKHLTYNQLIAFHNIADTLLDKRRRLQARVFEITKDTDPENDELLTLTRELEEVNLTIKRANPNFHRIMSGQMKTLKQIRTELDARTTLIQYSYFNDSLYCLSLSAKQARLMRIPWGEDQANQVNMLLQSIHAKNPGRNEHTSILADELKLDQVLTDEIEHLIIIPDGELYRIPFEILETNNKPLIGRYTIQYRSGMMDLDGHSSTKVPQPFLAFAPFNEGENDNLEIMRGKLDNDNVHLDPLPYSGSEVEKISALWKGNEYLGADATESNFKKNSKYSRFIHLATHSLIDDRNPMYNKIVFSNEDREDGFLYTYELFNMQLQAELVTLSACNTGVGRFYEGEGMVSLATGFNFAGVENVVMSLWEVPDQTTAEIMTSFYEHLHDGLDIPAALRQAKLDFINNHDSNLVAPYYWAGFVVNTKKWPEGEEDDHWTFVLMLVTLTLVGIAAVVVNRRK